MPSYKQDDTLPSGAKLPLFAKGDRVQLTSACVRFNEVEVGETFTDNDAKGVIVSDPEWDAVADRFVSKDGKGDWLYGLRFDSGEEVNMHEQTIEAESA